MTALNVVRSYANLPPQRLCPFGAPELGSLEDNRISDTRKEVYLMRTLFGIIMGVVGGYVAYTTVLSAVEQAAAAVNAAITVMP